jgi:hypothetical protein
MFTVRGDGVWLYNVSGRPVFADVVSGSLFYIGLAVALWRWRKPEYALVLFWLPVSLIPAAITWPAPNFVRALGALPVTFVFPAIALENLKSQISNFKWSARLLKFEAGYLIFAVLIAVNGVWTAHDYFGVWPRNAEVRWLYQAIWTQAARWLDAESDMTTVAASGLKVHDLDPQTYDLLLRRRDVKVKWFDCRTSILLPANGQMRYISPDFFPCDTDLWNRFLGNARIVAQPRWPDTGTIIFTGTVTVGGHRLEQDPASPGPLGPLVLLESEITRSKVAHGSEAELLTFWTVAGHVPAPTSIFVHVVGSDDKPLAQWDGFDFGEAQLESGDQLVERHRFLIPASTAPGTYRVIAGVYNPVTNQRFHLPNGDDHAWLGTIQVR